ncbi:thaumatin-like protein 1 [Coffea arabica]|nr:thaumatin-like protein 1 [Coffea arabica]
MGASSTVILSLFVLCICKSKGVSGATITFVNKCEQTVWPGILGNSGLGSTGFELQRAASRSFQAPTGWSGRFWGRTGCTFDGSGQGSCATGDCGSGKIECDGAGASTPATLAEFTLGSGSQDFYDVSLVDGYNLPMLVEGSGGSGSCASTGCTEDLNSKCPNELKIEGGGACRSACDAFGTPEYCCKGQYASPSTCSPSVYSQIFKSACPKSYSYAFDDSTSTFTCTGADYTVTFCPTSPSSQKASKPEGSAADGSGSGSASGSGSGSGPVQESMLADGSWLANLATGDSIRRHHPFGAAQLWVLVLTVMSSIA